MSVLKFSGVDSDIEVFEDKLVHTNKGILGAVAGLVTGGATSIPFASITSVAYGLLALLGLKRLPYRPYGLLTLFGV